MRFPVRPLFIASASILLLGCGSGSSSSRPSTTTAATTSNTSTTASTSSANPTTTSLPSGLRLETLTPDTGPLRGELVTLEGQEFEAGMSVDFDGVPGIDLKVISPTQATVRAPVLRLGRASVTVTKNAELSSLAAAYDVRPDRVGELDPTFGVGGVTRFATKAPGAYSYDTLVDSTIDSQGRIVAVGVLRIGLTAAPSAQRVTVARFLPNGGIDSTFGVGGRLTLPLITAFTAPQTGEDAKAVAVDSADRVLVATTGYQRSDARHAVVRLTVNGAIDTTYGINGVVRGQLRTSRAFDLLVDSADRLIVTGTLVPAGTTIYRPAVWRYTATGRLDTTFGVNGSRVLPAASGSISEASFDAQGNLLVSGWAYLGVDNNGAVFRMNANGALDPTFGVGGRVIVDLGPGGTDYVQEHAVDSQGRIVLLTQRFGAVVDWGLRRLLADGTPDATFGPVALTRGPYMGLTIAAGDRILFTSSATPAGGVQGMTVFQYMDNGAPDLTFAAGKPYFHYPLAGRQYPSEALIDSEGRVVVVGGARGDTNTGLFVFRVR